MFGRRGSSTGFRASQDLRSGCSARIRIDCVSAQLSRDAIRCRSCVKTYVIGNTRRRIPVVSGAKILRSQGCARVSEMRAEVVWGAPDSKKRNVVFTTFRGRGSSLFLCLFRWQQRNGLRSKRKGASSSIRVAKPEAEFGFEKR